MFGTFGDTRIYKYAINTVVTQSGENGASDWSLLSACMRKTVMFYPGTEYRIMYRVRMFKTKLLLHFIYFGWCPNRRPNNKYVYYDTEPFIFIIVLHTFIFLFNLADVEV